MFNLLFGTSIVATLVGLVKEANEKVIPAENWANKKLIHQDIANNISAKQRIKYAEQGRYKTIEKYHEPHRDSASGKIMIENSRLYKEDVKNYGIIKAFEWAEQGRYNLNKEELKKEYERINKEWEELYSLLR